MSSEKIIALYERLSREDENLGESYSIQNQKKLLEDFCREKGWTRFRHFTDDGISGTTFERPSFKEMISLVEDGEVETIVLKDMSRLGRDYLVVGQLREFFRKKGVRLIAINDNHDSSNGDDDFLVFRDVMNEMYAKDISKKIRSTFKSKGKSGKHVASVTPYGYLKDENDGNHWIIDEEAAEVVRLIFKWTIDGLGPYQIANLLQEKKVEIPAVHMARFGQGNNRHKQVKDPYGWGSSTVVGILKKREYLGHTVNFKTQKHFKDKKSHYVSEDNWVIFENTQDAIIDQDTFDTVQKLRANVRRYPDGWGEHHVLTGLMYCADCGAKMYVHRTSNGKRIAQYTCSAYTKVPCGTLCKTQHRINESVVLENGARYLLWNAPFYSVLGVLLATRYALQSLGQKVLPLFSSVIELVGKIVFVLFFIPKFAYNAVILCEPIIWCFMAAYLVLVYLHDPFVFPKKAE